ncbi:MAG: hypothetical protein IJN96_02370 [Clostridia bacterium]|nr:hypothetical protein [Clostridia bacterium]
MFEKEYDFGFSSLDKNYKVHVGAVMNVLQDVSFEHAEQVGIDYERLENDSLALLLAGWRVQFHKRLHQGKAVAKTGITEIRACDAVRRYELYQDGESKASATAIWFTVDTKERKVTRVPEDYAAAFESVDQENNGLPYERIMPDKTAEFLEEFSVEPRDIDANNHFNNVKYIEKILNFVPREREIDELRIKYRRELGVNDVAYIFGKKDTDNLYFEFRNVDDELCAFAYVDMK